MSVQSALVVDDSKVAHIKLRKMLEKRSISVEWVKSGEEAVAVLETQSPDVVFMDILMPGMDGFEATKKVLANPRNSNLAIVMCSGNASDEDREKANSLGAAGFIGKPYTGEELDGALNDASARLAAATPAPAPEPVAAEPAAPAAAETTVAAAIDIDAIIAQATAAAQKAAQQAAEDIFARLSADLRQEVAATAASSGRDAAMEVAADTAGTVAREASAEIARSTAEQVVGEQVQAAMAGAPQPPAGIDAAAVTNVLRKFVDSDDFKRRVVAAAPAAAAPTLDTAEITRIADGAARQVAGEVANQIATQVAAEASNNAAVEASRSAAENARLVAEETVRKATAEATSGGDDQTRAAVRSAVSGLRMFNYILGAGLFAVIAWLVVDGLNLLK